MADSKISDLAAITTLGGTEEFVVAIGGETKKITAADLDTEFGGGGGGSAHSYLGYNTVGGSNLAAANKRWYCKKVTPGDDGLILGIGAYWNDGTSTPVPCVAIFDDNAGSPGRALAGGGGGLYIGLDVTGTDERWVTLPITYHVTDSVDYWLGYMFFAGTPNLFYDGSGADKTFDNGAGVPYLSPPASFSTPGHHYCIRADFLPC